jgi:tetratricopeptide (TPR) repeat protein
MRFFAEDIVPRLSIAPEDVPGPWIVPWMLPRRHRDRLVGLLCQALLRFDDRLRFLELRWSERFLIEQRCLAIPRHALVWWRIGKEPPMEAGAVLMATPRVASGLMIYDFEAQPDLVRLGWLGPLKERVLHRITDVLMDGGEVDQPEAMVDVLREASRTLLSPVEVVDLVEVLRAWTVQGRSLSDARAEGLGRVLANRFAPDAGDEAPADAYVRALVEVGTKKPLSEETRAVLTRAGLLDRGMDEPVPMADALQEPAVLRRALAWMIELRRPTVPPVELAPGWFEVQEIDWAPERAVVLPVPAVEPLLEMEEEPAPPSTEPIVATAKAKLEAGDPEAAAKVLIESIRRGDDRQWGEAALRAAGHVLLGAAMSMRRTEPVERLAALAEAGGDLLERAGDEAGAAGSLLLVGAMFLSGNLLEPAMRVLLRAKTVTEHIGSMPLTAFYKLQWGSLCSRTGAYEEARVALQQARVLSQSVGDKEGEIMALVELGRLPASDPALALADEKEALALAATVGDQWGQANALNELGFAHLMSNDFSAAHDYLTKAQKLYQALGNRRGEAYALMTLSVLHAEQGDVPAARAALEHALELHRAIGNRQGEARTLALVGAQYQRQGDIAAARTALQEALEIYRAIGDHGDEAVVLQALAKLTPHPTTSDPP